MAELRKGRQTPTQSVVLPYFDTKGQSAISSYNESGRTAQEWQELLLSDIERYTIFSVSFKITADIAIEYGFWELHHCQKSNQNQRRLQSMAKGMIILL